MGDRHAFARDGRPTSGPLEPLPAIHQAKQVLRRLASAAVGLIYPPICIACSAALAEPHALCAACWRRLHLIERPYCERLGTPFAVDLGGPALSPLAVAEPPSFGCAR